MEIAIIIAQALLKYGPTVAKELSLVFQKEAPTAADFDKVFEVAEKTGYDDYMKAARDEAAAPKPYLK